MDTEKKFNNVYFGVMGILTGITLCRKGRCITSALILIYAAIDSLAFLEYGSSSESGMSFRKRFTGWVKRYLDSKQIGCSPDELYYARCGLLHDLTAQSDGSQRGSIHKLCYAWGNVKSLTKKQMGRITVGRANMIHVDKLLDLLIQGIETFRDDVVKDSEKSRTVNERLEKIHIDILLK